MNWLNPVALLLASWRSARCYTCWFRSIPSMFFILPSIKYKASSYRWNSQRFNEKIYRILISVLQHGEYVNWVPRTNEDQFSYLRLFFQNNIALWCKNMMIFDCYKLQEYLLCMTVFFAIVRDLYNCLSILGVQVDINHFHNFI